MINLKNKFPRILVIGDLMVDHYLWGECDRVSPEAPVPVVNIKDESKLLGGAGNVINNLKALGAEVDLISIIGNCGTSIELKALLTNIEVDTKYLYSDKDRITSRKTRIISSHQQVVRYDFEDSNEINDNLQNYIINTYKKLINKCELVLISDYGKGIFTKKLTQSLISIAKTNAKKVLVDPKGFDYSKYTGAYLLTPNIKEAAQATNIDIIDDLSIKKAIVKLKNQFKLDVSLITLSEKGVAVYDNNFRILPTFSREVFDVTGAGDTVLASLGFALACQVSLDEAIEFSNLAAGIVVGKIGSATATLNEIIEYESNHNKSSSDAYIKSFDEIVTLTNELKNKGKKIVFTNGCFDLLHVGHVKYLETAKSYGDILIIGLNSDVSVTSLKGKDRPIIGEMDRAYILAALEVVDYVVIFEDDTPYSLIKAISPHTLVKGGDYKGKKVVGQDIAQELKLVDFIDGKSSTETIKLIRKSN